MLQLRPGAGKQANIFKKRKAKAECEGLPRTDQAVREPAPKAEEATRPAQARASQNHAEPRVSCFGRPRPQAGKLGQTG